MIRKYVGRAVAALLVARDTWRASVPVPELGYDDNDPGVDVDALTELEQLEAPVATAATTGHGSAENITAEKGWMQTYTGRQFFPLEPRAEDIDIADVAHGLSVACRYGGQCSRFYSVAEHCVLVSLYVEQAAIAAGMARNAVRAVTLEALLHDSAEAYIGDMIRPLKHQPEMSAFRTAEAKIERAVFERFNIVSTPRTHAMIKDVDNRILVDEIHALMKGPDQYRDWILELRALGAPIVGLGPLDAEREFLRRFAELTP